MTNHTQLSICFCNFFLKMYPVGCCVYWKFPTQILQNSSCRWEHPWAIRIFASQIICPTSPSQRQRQGWPGSKRPTWPSSPPSSARSPSRWSCRRRGPRTPRSQTCIPGEKKVHTWTDDQHKDKMINTTPREMINTMTDDQHKDKMMWD